MSRSSQAKPLTAAKVSTGDPSAPQSSSRMFVERGLLSNLAPEKYHSDNSAITTPDKS